MAFTLTGRVLIYVYCRLADHVHANVVARFATVSRRLGFAAKIAICIKLFRLALPFSERALRCIQLKSRNDTLLRSQKGASPRLMALIEDSIDEEPRGI